MGWLSGFFTDRELSRSISTLIERIDDMSETMDTLVERVTEIETVADAAIELLHGLKAQLDEAIAGGDMGQVQALSDRLGEQSRELADAIAANTGEPPLEPEV